MAKAVKEAASQAVKAPKRKALKRRLDEAKLAQAKAQEKAGKLRGRLERAESRLAKTAEDLVALQSLLEQMHAPAEAARNAHAKHGSPAGEPAASKKPASPAGTSHSAKSAHAARGRTQKNAVDAKAVDPKANGKPSEQDSVEAGQPAGVEPTHAG